MRLRLSRPDTAAAQCAVRGARYGIVPAGGTARIPVRLTNHRLALGESCWPVEVAVSGKSALRLLAQFQLWSTPDPQQLQVVMTPAEDGVVLAWFPVPGTRYCIYSGPTVDACDRFETCVSDTFAFLPASAETIRFFDVRYCDGPPAPAPVPPALSATP